MQEGKKVQRALCVVARATVWGGGGRGCSQWKEGETVRHTYCTYSGGGTVQCVEELGGGYQVEQGEWLVQV